MSKSKQTGNVRKLNVTLTREK